MKYSLSPAAAGAVAAALCGGAAAAADSVSGVIERVEVTSRSILPSQPMAGDYEVLTRLQVEQRRPFSVVEALRELPGLSVVAEDTAGTHLNIGIRGLNPRRSSRVLLLEDGAPTVFFAAYSDPSAHYSTPMHRIERIETIKGAGQVVQGPQTLGGMLNFITRGVPRSGLAAGAQFSAGGQGFREASGFLGLGADSGGFVIDWGRRLGQGIRAEHAFDLRDLALKAQWREDPRHTLTFKAARFEETSHFSETGLTAQEYLTSPRGVPGTAGERFLMSRNLLQVVHDWDLSRRAELSTQAYFSRVYRESQRLREFEPDEAEQGWGELEIEPAIRPRRYRVQGLESRLKFSHTALGAPAQWTLGLRLHEEAIDRRKFLTDGLRGPVVQADERLSVDVRAVAAFAEHRLSVGRWALSQGLRVEEIQQDKRLFHADAQNRTAFDPRAVDTLRSRQRVLLPGLGATWTAPDRSTWFVGVHRGFAPPRPDRDIVDSVLQKVNPEQATITEVGLRSGADCAVQWGLTVFNMEVRDIVVQAGGVFRNEGRARHAGVELDARIPLLGGTASTPGPLELNLSYTHLPVARFLGSGTVGGEGEDGYGSYSAGNRLPYTPVHTLAVGLNLDAGRGWKARLGATHTGVQFANTENFAGLQAQGHCPSGDVPEEGVHCGLYGQVPAVTLIHAGLSYSPAGSRAAYFVSVENLTDRRTIASRTNGIQPGRGRLAWAGVRVSF